MRKYTKFLAGATSVVIGLSGLFGSVAMADSITVEYTTQGAFGADAPNNSDTLDSTPAGVSLTFTADSTTQTVVTPSETQPLEGPSFADFGVFNLTKPLVGSVSFSSPFTLTIIQTVPPGNANGSTTATISGTVKRSGNNLTITFLNPTAILSSGHDSVFYNIDPDPITLTSTTTQAHVFGDIDSSAPAPPPGVPLPASVLGGGVLLSLCAAAKLKRRVFVS